jgi:hypothetical protein
MSQGAQWRIREWFPNLDERIHERLRIYQVELLRWTAKINLISHATTATADRVHFADSILGVQLCQQRMGKTSETIWDLGSGNGFPGLIWAILHPEQNYMMIDSDERKISGHGGTRSRVIHFLILIFSRCFDLVVGKCFLQLLSHFCYHSFL